MFTKKEGLIQPVMPINKLFWMEAPSFIEKFVADSPKVEPAVAEKRSEKTTA